MASVTAGSGSHAARTLGGLFSTFDRAQQGSQCLVKMHMRNNAFQRGRSLLTTEDDEKPIPVSKSPSPPRSCRPTSADRRSPIRDRRSSPPKQPSPTSEPVSDDDVIAAAFGELESRFPPPAASVSTNATASNPLHSMDPLRILEFTWKACMHTPQRRHRFVTSLKRNAGCSEERALENLLLLEALVEDFQQGLLQWNVLRGVFSLIEDGVITAFADALSSPIAGGTMTDAEVLWSPKAEAVWRAALVHFKEPPLRYC